MHKAASALPVCRLIKQLSRLVILDMWSYSEESEELYWEYQFFQFFQI